MVFWPTKPACSGIATSWRSRRGARTPHLVTADGSICLVALLASHISSRRRLEYLQHCLRSVAAQEEGGVDALYLSWGATDDALCAEAAAMLEAMAMRLPFRLVLLHQRERLSQYAICFLGYSLTLTLTLTLTLKLGYSLSLSLTLTLTLTLK